MNKNKVTISIVLLLIFISVLGYLVINKRSIVDVGNNHNDAIDDTANNNDEQKIDDITKDNWQTYRNEEYGFEFQYPQQWIINNASLMGANTYGRILSFEARNTDKLIKEKLLHPGERFNLLISYWDDINNDYARGGGQVDDQKYANLEDFFNSNKISLKKKIGELDIDGYRAYEVIIGGEGANYGIMLENNGIFELSFNRAWDKSELTSVDKKIISSFKFIK